MNCYIYKEKLHYSAPEKAEYGFFSLYLQIDASPPIIGRCTF